MFDAARVPTFKLISTGNRPELELAEGHKWHLFLSHTWGTGQDQCATIKRHLCLLLTGVHVFLDVDDLEVTLSLILTLSLSLSLTLTLGASTPALSVSSATRQAASRAAGPTPYLYD